MKCENRMNGARFQNRQGFTLIEVLISITLIGVIMVLIFGGLRISVNAWETGEKNIDASQHQQVVLDLMRRQLASMRAAVIETSDERKLGFSGGPSSMAYISSYAMAPGNFYGDVYVRYWVEDAGNRYILKMYENNTLFENFPKASGAAADGGNTYNLTEIWKLKFSYYIREEGQGYWTESWSSDEADAHIPAAVRCVLQKDKDFAPFEIFVATRESAAE